VKAIRTIVAAIVAFSVVVLPVAGSVAYAASLEGSLSAPSACCPSHGTPCEKKMPTDCDLTCVVKCAVSNAAIVAPVELSPVPLATERSLASAELLPYSSQSPPLPPPRL
jgi:hypothetical protein